jgi:transcription elongation factor SPT6
MRLSAHLKTLEELLVARSEKTSRLESELNMVEAQNKALNDPKPMQRVLKKTQREALWNPQDYKAYLGSSVEARHVLDVNSYVKLIKEGNDAIRKKELPLLELKDNKSDQKRSRRFDRDYYRTCVAEGLRAVSYSFLLPPNRVGVKIEDEVAAGGFDFMKIMPGEENTEGVGDPRKWAAPTLSETPEQFASDLIGSGDLVLLSSPNASAGSDSNDPFRGCRYVAALELASEPRVRKHLRNIYRKNAYLSTRPTSKGLDEIDAFHDYYGLHLIRDKPVHEHFPMDEDERARQGGMYTGGGAQIDDEMRKRQKESCVMYLHMLKAERTGHLTINVHMPLLDNNGAEWYKSGTQKWIGRSNQDMSALRQPLEKAYLPLDGDTNEWNEERLKVLRYALVHFLVPQFENELRRDLQEAASKVGVSAAAENLKTAAMEGPYRPTSLLYSESRFIVPTGDLKMVGVCCVADGREASYMTAVSETGEAVDFLAIPAGTSIQSGAMREKVIMFLLQFRPAAVVVGISGGYESRMFFRRMDGTDGIINEAMRRWTNRDAQGDDEDDEAFDIRRSALRKFSAATHYLDDEDEDWKCNVDLVDDSVSQLYGRSVRGKKEFPEFPVNHRCAISIARYAKDPLAEYTYTWNVASDAGMFGTEMLFLNIHPLQQLLPRTFLLREYERVLCDAVASVGSDVNAACQHDHLRGLLLFVPGLGPRKAANMKQSLVQQGGVVGRRRDLLEKRFMGPTVYNNAVAFLRIRQNDQLVEVLNPLDDTRIHPDVYIRHKWAVKIAFDALDRSHQDSKANQALIDVRKNSMGEVDRLFDATKKEWLREFGQTETFDYKGWDPRTSIPSDHWNDAIDDLNLKAFADKIQQIGQGRWHSQIDEMLTWEFRLPYVDPRNPMERLSGDKLFSLITNESDQSLRPGKEVTGKVVNNGDFGSRVKLEGNIEAFIPLRNLADEHVEAAEEIVHVGQVVTAIVAEVKKEHMTVDLSLKMEDFRRKPSDWARPESFPILDRHFDHSAGQKIEEDTRVKREQHVEVVYATLGRSPDDGEGGTAKKRTGRVVRRACTHPAFRNGTNEEVDKELKEGGPAMVGESLVRPSRKKGDSLAIHWVAREGGIMVIEINEEDKETDVSIGKVLKIKDAVYGSIDELISRHIAPMNDFAEELVNHRKFSDRTEDEVDENLIADKRAKPASIPYALCWMELFPGYFSLRYFISGSTPRHHSIGLGPKGYSWSGKIFPKLDALLYHFKKNPRGTPFPKPAPTQPPAGGAPVASVPPPKNRWGSRPAAPPQQPPPPPGPPNWQQLQPPPLPVAVGGWAAVPGWSQPPPPPMQPPRPPVHRPPPPAAPPPLAYGHVRNVLPQNNYGAPPQQLRPPPPQQPPAFGGGPAPPVGRGRGRTLPAWMSKQG